MLFKIQMVKLMDFAIHFVGSARYQHQLYQDAMCNPRWKEIIDELLEGQTTVDCPDIIA